MGFGARIGDTLRLPTRRGRRVLSVLVVLAVAAAGGATVALSAPALMATLGFAAPQVAVLAPPVPRPLLGALPPDSPEPTGAGLAAALDEAGDAMPGRFTGVVLDAAGGDALWERTPGDGLVPGSTGKLLTAAAALLTLDPTDTFTTRVVAGRDPGTVVLVGGGDPTLSVLPPGRDGVYPRAPRVADLATQVSAATSRPVTRVLVDTGRYTGPTMADGWFAADVAAGFVTPIEPLMVDGGRIDPTLQDGPRTDSPALVAGQTLAGLLGVDPDTVAEGTPAPDAQQLAEVSSASVSDLVEHLLRSSDNVLAEALAREVALGRNGDPSFSGAAIEVLAALAQAGFDPAGTVLVDGSGLSTDDRVTARLLGALLSAAAAPPLRPHDTEFLRPILTGLPVAGGDGTLEDRFALDAPSAPGRGVVRAKTGTLNGVSSLAGVVTDADGRLLVFALMSNGGSPATVRPKLDAMAATLSRCGCR